MSKISISNKTPIPPHEQDAKLVFAIKRMTGLAIAEVKQRLSQGSSAYLYRTELFLNDHVEVDSIIRKLLDAMRQYEVEPYILEILQNESWDSPIDLKLSLISEEVLLNVLNESKGKFS